MIIYSVKDVRNGSRSVRIRTLAIASKAAAKRKRERRQNKSVAKPKDM